MRKVGELDDYAVVNPQKSTKYTSHLRSTTLLALINAATHRNWTCTGMRRVGRSGEMYCTARLHSTILFIYCIVQHSHLTPYHSLVHNSSSVRHRGRVKDYSTWVRRGMSGDNSGGGGVGSECGECMCVSVWLSPSLSSSLPGGSSKAGWVSGINRLFSLLFTIFRVELRILSTKRTTPKPLMGSVTIYVFNWYVSLTRRNCVKLLEETNTGGIGQL